MNLLKRLTMMASLLAGLLLTLLVSYGSSATPVAAADEPFDPLQIVLDHLAQNRAEYGLVEADLRDYVVTDMYQTRDTGVTHIYLRQRINGLDIWGGQLNANIMPDGSILTLNNGFVPQLDRALYDSQPTLTAAEALNHVAEQLRWPITSYFVAEQNLGGTDQMQILSTGGIAQDPVPARLIYYRTEDGRLLLAWEALVEPINTSDYWQMAIDAHTGEILRQFNWTVSHNPADIALSDGRTFGLNNVSNISMGNMAPAMQSPDAVADGSSYRVFALPVESPIHASPPSPADGRVLVTEPADALASPFGWHDTNGVAGAEFTVTRGNNVHAYTDTNNSDTPDPGSDPDGGAGLTFDFPLDLTQAPSTYRPASVTNLFYWNNITHDLLYRHGFDESSGNFQVNNYGRGGIGNDDVRAEGQDGGGTNNANFFTPPDGSRPRMQMYNWTTTTPNRDGDFDAGIVAHEYGHGWSIRLTGGPANTSCLGNAEQMGEGWSDYLSVVFTARPGDTRTTNRGVGTYALGQPTNGQGIRPAPYNTDMGANSYTYANLPSMAIPHGVGFVWNTMLWEMYWNLVDEHGFNPNLYQDWTTGGNNLALRLVTDGLKLQPCSPGFVDGRNAILAADTALTGGQNQCLIWEAFAKRGLGFSANQGSSNSRSDGTPAFDMPDACMGVSAAPMSQDICQGSTAAYTISAGAAFTGNVDLSAVGNPAPSSVNFSVNPIVAPGSSNMTVNNTAAVAPGNYSIEITADDGTVTDTVEIDLNVFAGAPGSVTLTSPAHLATGVGVPVSFAWTADANATGYLLQVATDMAFTNLVYSNTVGTNNASVGGLNTSTVHYWRVTPNNICGVGTTSAVFSFRTESAPGDCNVDETAVEFLSEGFESGAPGWSTAGSTGASTWASSSVRTNSGNLSYLAVNLSTVSDQRLASPAVELTAGYTNYTLQFWNHQTIERRDATRCWDGAIVEISTNGGSSWTQLSSLTHPYDGLIQTGFSNPLANLQGWCGDPRNWHKPVVDLSAYEGQTVNFRWRLGTDSTVGREGWYVDDVRVQACQAASTDYGVEAHAPVSAQNGDAGTAVAYTVHITNTGLVSDSYNIAPVSTEGWNITIEPTSVVDLDPNEMASVVVTVTIPTNVDAGTVDNTTVTVSSQADPFINDAVVLATSVNDPDIHLTTTSMEVLVTAEQTITQSLTIHNDGGSNLTWSITEEPGATGCTGTIPWLAVDPASGTTLGGYATPVVVTFDATGVAAGVYTGALCVGSNDPVTPQITIPVTMTVSEAGVQLGPDAALMGMPNETVTYTVAITNTGNITDTFNLSLTGSNWLTELSVTEITLMAGEEGSFEVTVTVPAGAMADEMDMVTVTATSQTDNSIMDEVELTTTAATVYGLQWSVDTTAHTGSAGEVVTYTFTLTNTGNTTDTYAITHAGHSWTTVASPTNLTLGAGESADFTVSVTIDADAVHPDDDTVTVTATSQGDNSATESVDLTTTVAEIITPPNPVIYLPMIMRP